LAVESDARGERPREALLSEGWNTLSLEHFTTSKYIKAKALWEVVLERRDA